LSGDCRGGDDAHPMQHDHIGPTLGPTRLENALYDTMNTPERAETAHFAT